MSKAICERCGGGPVVDEIVVQVNPTRTEVVCRPCLDKHRILGALSELAERQEESRRREPPQTLSLKGLKGVMTTSGIWKPAVIGDFTRWAGTATWTQTVPPPAPPPADDCDPPHVVEGE